MLGRLKDGEKVIIHCVGCGYCVSIKHVGLIEELENSVHEAITEGWRWAKDHDGYACPKCCKEGFGNEFYELCCGKLRKSNKVNSYKHMLGDLMLFLDRMDE